MKGKLLMALVLLALVLGTVLVACDDGQHVNISDPADGTKVTVDKYYIRLSVKGDTPSKVYPAGSIKYTDPANGDVYIFVPDNTGTWFQSGGYWRNDPSKYTDGPLYTPYDELSALGGLADNYYDESLQQQ